MDDLDQYMFGRVPMRAWDLVYAALGPAGTAYLVSELESGGRFDGAAAELRSRLGRAPGMLVLLGVAMGVAQDRFFAEIRGEYPHTRHLGTVHKLLGWQVAEAMEAFHLTEDSMREYLHHGWRGYGDDEWPPRVARRRQDGADGRRLSPRTEGPSGVAAYADMAATLSREGLQVPAVPEHLVADLRATESGWATKSRLDPEEAYLQTPEALADVVRPRARDFMLVARRPQDWPRGTGLFAKLGPVVVAHQLSFDSARPGSIGGPALTNLVTASWSRLVAELEALDITGGDAEVVIMFSSETDRVYVLQPDGSDGRGFWGLEGWGAPVRMALLPDDPTIAEARNTLRELAEGAGPVGLAAAHLDRVVTAAGF